MRSLARAARQLDDVGEPIPCPIAAVNDLGFVSRRGQCSLWVAGPGVGKSIVALNYALRSGVPTLYVSADTDRADQIDRSLAMVGDLGLIPPDVRFEFESSPTARDLAEMCDAYGMVFGQYPHLIIVDTLSKVWSDAGDETGRNKDAVDRCQDIARHTGAHAMVLHHATKGFDAGNVPIPLDGLMSGVSKQPEQVMTMWRDDADRLTFAPVKNRSGKADPTAQRLRSFALIDFDRMSVDPLVVQQFDWTRDVELL